MIFKRNITTITKVVIIICALFISVMLIGCQDPVDDIDEDEITLSQSSVQLEVGESETVVATVAPEDAVVTWTSDNEGVATVINGVITAVDAGTATITATNGEASATVVVTVHPVPVTYEVTFAVNGGTEITTQVVNENTKATRPDDPTRVGYRFIGWYADENFSSLFSFEGNINENTTIYALWLADKYDVFFEVNGGSTVQKQSISHDATVNKPTAPTKAGYVFDKWYVDEELTTEFDFASVITGETTLYAGWTELFDLSFVANGGTSVATLAVPDGSTATQPTDPTRVGYDFAGWYADEELTTEFDFGSAITEDTTVYADWTPRNDVAYQIEYYIFDKVADEFVLEETEDLAGTADETITIVPKEIEGYMSEYESYEATIHADGSLVLKINYVEFSISFTYELNGGNFTYPTKSDMRDDFISDYNTFMNTDTYNVDNFGNGTHHMSFYLFFYDEEMRDKWEWMIDYIKAVGTSVCVPAVRALYTVPTPQDYAALDPNHIWVISYEIRAFVLDIRHTLNTWWASSDYTDPVLGHGFWETFVEWNETTSYFGYEEPVDADLNPYKEGFVFDGWYLTPDFSGEAVTVIDSPRTILYAKWEALAPVESVTFTNPIDKLEKSEQYQLEIEISPSEAFNKRHYFLSSDERILKVDRDTGIVTAENVGTATITVVTVDGEFTSTVEISVYTQENLDVRYDDDFNGTLSVGQETTLVTKGEESYADVEVEFTSSDENIITVDNNGVVTAVALGTATIQVSLKDSDEVSITVTILVVDQPSADRIQQLLAILAENNQAVVETINASLYYHQNDQHFAATYGSANLFLFDGLNLNDSDHLIDPVTQTNKTPGKMDSVEFIVVHDTANLNGGLMGHASYWKQTSHSTSIHYTVGDFGIVQSLDTEYGGHHAGDGTSTTFSWNDTSIAADGNTNPVIDISDDGYFTFNDEKSSILAPTKGGEILDSSYFSILGPNWKIGDDGNYYLGTTWFSSTYNTIGSRGGNLNSIGIEMCVNTSGDIYDTWQRTAKLIAKLLVEQDLDLSRVIMHDTISGKLCPQSLIMTGNWDVFMKMVELEYLILTEFSDATITLESHNTDLLSNTGRIIGSPVTTQTVTYTISVEIDGTTESITLGTIVPGTASWNQYNGLYKVE